MVTKYNFFILQVQKAWITPSTRQPRTIHHLGKGVFMVAGRTIKLRSKMKWLPLWKTNWAAHGPFVCATFPMSWGRWHDFKTVRRYFWWGATEDGPIAGSPPASPSPCIGVLAPVP
jgi:hypothetical protein